MKFDTFLSAEEAVAYGLADEVITTRYCLKQHFAPVLGSILE